jgi:hypothetical protein
MKEQEGRVDEIEKAFNWIGCSHKKSIPAMIPTARLRA